MDVSSHTSILVGDDVCIWGGYRPDLPLVHDSPKKRQFLSSFDVFNVLNATLVKRPTTGTPPNGAMGYGSCSIGNDVYYFGGWCDENCYLNDLLALNTTNNKWRQTAAKNGPMKKKGCGMIPFSISGEECILVVGGYGPLPTKPPSHAQYTPYHGSQSLCLTNEVHIMCVSTTPAKWIVPKRTGNVFPPSAHFSINTLPGTNRAIIFGGICINGNNDHLYWNNDVFLVSFTNNTVDFQRLDHSAASVPRPNGRANHSSVVISSVSGNGEEKHYLLVLGGGSIRSNGPYVLANCWLMEIASKNEWKQISLPEVVTNRENHSMSCYSMSDHCKWLIVSGGDLIFSPNRLMVVELIFSPTDDNWTVINVLNEEDMKNTANYTKLALSRVSEGRREYQKRTVPVNGGGEEQAQLQLKQREQEMVSELQYVQRVLEDERGAHDVTRRQKDDLIQQKDRQLREKDVRLQQYQEAMQDKDRKLHEKDELLQKNHEALQQKEAVIHQNQEVIREKDKELREKSVLLQQNQAVIHDKDMQLEEIDELLQQNRQALQQNQEAIQLKDRQLQVKDGLLQRNHDALQHKDVEIQRNQEAIKQNEKQLEEKCVLLKENEKAIQYRDRQLKEKEELLQQNREELQQKDVVIKRNQEAIQSKEKQLKEKDELIRQNREALQRKDVIIQQNEDMIQDKDRRLQEKYALLQQSSEDLQHKDRIIQQNQEVIRDKDEQLREKDVLLQQNHGAIQEKDEQLREKDVLLEQNREAIQDKDEQLQKKDVLLEENQKAIQDKDGQLKAKEELLQQNHETLQCKDVIIQQSQDTIQQKEKQLEEKDALLQKNKKAIQDRDRQLREKDCLLQQSKDTIQDRDGQLREKDGLLQQNREALQKKDVTIQQNQEAIQNKDKELKEKDSIIKELRDSLIQQKELEVEMLKRGDSWKLSAKLNKERMKEEPSKGTSSQPPSHKDAFNFLKDATAQWEELARELEISYDDRRNIRNETTLTPSVKLEEVLSKWIQKQKDVTWEKLIEVCEKIGRGDIAVKIKGTLWY